MKEILKKLVADIPDYTQFPTAGEMDESSRRLAQEYADHVTLTEIGRTGMGNELLCLQIGNDPNKPNALFLGCPHPNEPIGAMMLEYISGRLAESAELREEFGYNAFIVKVWDYDGYVLNEGWLKGPFTAEHYARNIFRPASYMQVDWTFPLRHREYEFDATLPETAAVMKLIDEVRPAFIYSLHNSGFGGAYWYVSKPLPEDVYEELHLAATSRVLPLQLGEPELPVVPEFAPAVYGIVEVTDLYDLIRDSAGVEAAMQIGMGTNSASYGKKVCDAFSLTTEVPYFTGAMVSDTSPSDITRGEGLAAQAKYTEESNGAIAELVERSGAAISPDNPFLLTMRSFIALAGAFAGPADDERNGELATKAEKFSMLQESRFYQLLSFGMLVRMFEYEMDTRGQGAAAEQGELAKLKDEAEELFRKNCDELIPALDYEPVPIKTLVAIELECGLIIMQHLLKDRS
jgi:hypothetical protein